MRSIKELYNLLPPEGETETFAFRTPEKEAFLMNTNLSIGVIHAIMGGHPKKTE